MGDKKDLFSIMTNWRDADSQHFFRKQFITLLSTSLNYDLLWVDS